MPAMLVFLLKVNIALLLFCAGYYLVLRHLTFYTLNRIYLVAAILFATVYPKINLDSFAQRHQQLTQPVQVILKLQAPAQNLIKPIAQPNNWYWVEVIFWIGAGLFALRLLMQLYSLYKVYRNSSPAQIHGYQVRTIKGDSGPFSFWKTIYLNPDNHHPDDMRSILLHEQVHVNQWHTLDILLAEVSTVFYWFNPGIWLMKKAVRENIEFITDNKILNKGIDSKAYQYSLVNVSFAAGPQHIVNHFNLSTIKKRIIMMNAKRSSKVNLTRYAFLMPAVVALLLVFSISKAAFVTNTSKVMHKIASVIGVPVTQHNGVQNAALNHPYIAPKAKKVKSVRLADTTKKTGSAVKMTADSAIRIKVTGSTNTPIYIIDGKVGTEADMKTISPEKIATIDVRGAKTIPGVIYVTTKTNATANTLTAVKMNGAVSVTSHNDRWPLVHDTIRIITDTIKKDKDNAVIVRGYRVAKANNVRVGSTVSYARATTSADLSDISGKLFIIDGKPATEREMKKLSVLDIDRIAVKNDTETKSLYGDKAKNGVVFVVTKKKK